jgi:general stress protein 26
MKKRDRSKYFLMGGGLGNQLFMFTAGIYYSLTNQENVIFDLSRYTNGIPPHGSDIRSLNPDAIFQYRPYRWTAKTRLNNLSNGVYFSTYTSSNVGYDTALESHVLENQIFGYFQTYKYLEHPKVRNLIDSLFLDATSEWFDDCSSEMQNLSTISVHIRRGDYMNSQDSIGVLSSDYYSSAIKYTLENSSTKYSRVLVFSDDFVLAKKLFSRIEALLPVQFAESPENSPEETLMLMSQSDALVISNSSFSWWAAQLGNKSKFVVCPSKWLRGMSDPEYLFPPEWHPQESRWDSESVLQ